MFVYRIELRGPQDVYDLLKWLKKQHYISIVQNQPGNLRIHTNPKELAKHLVMDSKGDTYLVSDMKALFSIKSNIKFLTKDNQSLSIRDLRTKRYDIDDLLLNQPLADALASIEYAKGHQNRLRISWPQSTPRSLFPIAYPVITTHEDTYDRYDIEGWLQYRKRHHLRLRHPTATHRGSAIPLRFQELVNNYALEDLIQIHLKLMQERTLEYLVKLASGKKISNKRGLDLTLRKLRETFASYEAGLLHKKLDVNNIALAKLDKILQKRNPILAAHPELAHKDATQLRAIQLSLTNFPDNYRDGQPYNPAADGTYLSTFRLAGGLMTLGGAAGITSIVLFSYLALLIGIALVLGGIAATHYGSKEMGRVCELSTAIDRLMEVIHSHPDLDDKIAYFENENAVINDDLKHIASFKQRVRKNITDLHATAQSEVWEAVLCLIEAGVDVNASHEDGSILLSAVMADRWDVVQALIENGLMINHENKDAFYLALKTVIDAKNWDKTRYLLEHGALHFAQRDDKKQIKTSLKAADKWTSLSESHRLFSTRFESVNDSEMSASVHLHRI